MSHLIPYGTKQQEIPPYITVKMLTTSVTIHQSPSTESGNWLLIYETVNFPQNVEKIILLNKKKNQYIKF